MLPYYVHQGGGEDTRNAILKMKGKKGLYADNYTIQTARTLAKWFYLLYCVALYFVSDAHNVEFLLG